MPRLPEHWLNSTARPAPPHMLNGLSPLGDNPMDMSPNSLFAQNTFANSPPMQRESSWRRMEEGAGACRPRPWLSGQAAASHTTPAQFPGATAPSLVSLGSHSQLLPCPPRTMRSVGALGPVDMDHQAALAIGQSFEQASLQAKPASPSDPPTPKSKRARTPKSKAETGRKDAVEGTLKAACCACLLSLGLSSHLINRVPSIAPLNWSRGDQGSFVERAEPGGH